MKIGTRVQIIKDYPSTWQGFYNLIGVVSDVSDIKGIAVYIHSYNAHVWFHPKALKIVETSSAHNHPYTKIFK